MKGARLPRDKGLNDFLANRKVDINNEIASRERQEEEETLT